MVTKPPKFWQKGLQLLPTPSKKFLVKKVCFLWLGDTVCKIHHYAISQIFHRKGWDEQNSLQSELPLQGAEHLQSLKWIWMAAEIADHLWTADLQKKPCTCWHINTSSFLLTYLIPKTPLLGMSSLTILTRLQMPSGTSTKNAFYLNNIWYTFHFIQFCYGQIRCEVRKR